MRRKGGFKGPMGRGGMPNMGNLMKEAQKMQQKMADIQEEVGAQTIETTGGGGSIKVTVNGNQEITEITIDPELLAPEEVEMLQDLILVTVNDAMGQAKKMMEDAMGQVSGGLGLPPGLGF